MTEIKITKINGNIEETEFIGEIVGMERITTLNKKKILK
jgi:hypothetical protein